MFEHHRDEVVDSLSGGLGAKVKRRWGGEGLAEDHHSIHVSVYHCLYTGMGKHVAHSVSASVNPEHSNETFLKNKI